MMNKRDFAAFAAVVLVFLPSCFSTGRGKSPALELQEMNQTEAAAARKCAENFAGGFIKSLSSGDFNHWKQFIPEKNAANLDRKKFDAMRDELVSMFGAFVKGTYLGEVVSGKMRSYLWVLTFERKTPEGTERNEIVYFVRIHCEKGQKPAVNKFGVKMF